MRLFFSSFLLITFLMLTGCKDAYKESGHSSTNTFESYLNTMEKPNWYNDSEVDTLKILSWNVEHFVDDFDNPYIDNNREDNPPENMEERREMFAEVLRIANADIVVLQEFESDSYAKQLAENYFPELGYQVFAGHESPDWYMNVVVMSRIPLGIFHSYATASTPIAGEVDDDGNPASQAFTNNRMWTVDVLVNPEYNFALSGVHLKAGRGERNENWRIGQMDLLRSHYATILASQPQRNILAVGDFNSTPDSRELLHFLGEGSDVEFIDPLAGTDTYSHPADSAFWRIDHILPNTNISNEIVPGSVEVNYYFSPDSMASIADHLPITIEIIPSDD